MARMLWQNDSKRQDSKRNQNIMKNAMQKWTCLDFQRRLQQKRITTFWKTAQRDALEQQKRNVRATIKELTAKVEQESKESKPMLMSSAQWGEAERALFAALVNGPEFKAEVVAAATRGNDERLEEVRGA